jgi:hypothetical protein
MDYWIFGLSPSLKKKEKATVSLSIDSINVQSILFSQKPTQSSFFISGKSDCGFRYQICVLPIKLESCYKT